MPQLPSNAARFGCNAVASVSSCCCCRCCCCSSCSRRDRLNTSQPNAACQVANAICQKIKNGKIHAKRCRRQTGRAINQRRRHQSANLPPIAAAAISWYQIDLPPSDLELRRQNAAAAANAAAQRCRCCCCASSWIDGDGGRQRAGGCMSSAVGWLVSAEGRRLIGRR